MIKLLGPLTQHVKRSNKCGLINSTGQEASQIAAVCNARPVHAGCNERLYTGRSKHIHTWYNSQRQVSSAVCLHTHATGATLQHTSSTWCTHTTENTGKHKSQMPCTHAAKSGCCTGQGAVIHRVKTQAQLF